jgi:hypothetical protein
MNHQPAGKLFAGCHHHQQVRGREGAPGVGIHIKPGGVSKWLEACVRVCTCVCACKCVRA